MATTLPLYLIVVDDRLRVRKREDPLAIADYTRLYKEGVDLGSLECFYDGSQYWLTGGFLRIKAAKKAGIVELPFEVKQGSFSDALLDVLMSQNISNGARLSKKDRQEKIEIALNDPVLKNLNLPSLAKLIKVTEKEIETVKTQLNKNEVEQELLAEAIPLPKSFKQYPDYLQLSENAAIAKIKPKEFNPDLIINFAYSIDDCFLGYPTKPTIDLIFDSSQLVEFLQTRNKKESATRVFWLKYSSITLFATNLELPDELEDTQLKKLDDAVLLIIELLSDWKEKILINNPEISLLNLPYDRYYLGISSDQSYYEMEYQHMSLLQLAQK